MKLAILVTFAWAAITVIYAVPTNRSQPIKSVKSTENNREIDSAKRILTAADDGGKRSSATSSIGRIENNTHQYEYVSGDGKVIADGDVMKTKSLISSTRQNTTISTKSGSERKLWEKRVFKRALRAKRTPERSLEEKPTTRRALRKQRTSKQTVLRKVMSTNALRQNSLPKQTLRAKRMSRRDLYKKSVSTRTSHKQHISKQTLQNIQSLRKKRAVDNLAPGKNSPVGKSTGIHLGVANVTKPMSVISGITKHAAKTVMLTFRPNVRTKRLAESYLSTEPKSNRVIQTNTTKEGKKPKRKPRTERKMSNLWARQTRPRKRSTPKRSSSTKRTRSPCQPHSKQRQRTKPKQKPQSPTPITSVRVNRKCFCRLVTTARKRCYVFTNEKAGKCKSRWCPFEWKCIKTGHSNNVCIPEVRIEKIELIPGSHSSCRRLKQHPRTSWVFYKRLKTFTP